ncbi:hypothetical protein M0805_007124 [Coniferiporia weirii]|nr:hypothetical protein M0805_007124 [Coniferiporia weirii]
MVRNPVSTPFPFDQYSKRERPATVGGIDLVIGTTVAFGALLVYDVFCVTLAQEVSLVWPSRWTLGKGLFFLNRYLPFVDTFLSLHLLTGGNTDRECLLGFRAVTWLIVIGNIISELILMLRTYAFWGGGRRILIILVILGLVVFVPVIVVTQIETVSYDFRADSAGCVSTGTTSSIIFVAFLLLIICETSIVILTLIVVRRDHQQTQSALVKQMYRDSLLYYLCLISFSVVNLSIAVAAPPEFANWLTTPQRVIHSLLCTRVLLHIREHSASTIAKAFATQPTLAFAAAGAHLDLSSESRPTTTLDFGYDPSTDSSGLHVPLSLLGQGQSQPEDLSGRTQGRMADNGAINGRGGEIFEPQSLESRCSQRINRTAYYSG